MNEDFDVMDYIQRAGGSAFPVNIARGENGHQEIWRGMTLRDWFAGQALVGLLSHASGEDPHKAPVMAYTLADAMLDARNN